MSNVNFIDLDAVQPEVELTVKMFGETHKLVPVSLDDFLLNTRAIQDMRKKMLAGELDEIAQTEIIMTMILRAFPTMTRELLGKLTQAQLEKLLTAARDASGETDVVNQAEAEATENPQTAR